MRIPEPARQPFTCSMTTVDEHPLPSDPQDEFLRLFSRYSRRIYEFILTLVMRHADADEIFQDTCLVLWKKFDTYDPQGSFYGWACRIAYLEILQLRRKNQRMHTVSEDALEVLAEKAISGADNLSSRQHALEDCLQKLAATDRQLIDQRYRQRRSPKEIAQLGSQSVYAIYRALARVHTSLMTCVQRGMAREVVR
jgi:RNA polymerase sigma-70 factor (ECF subfamily)